MVHAIAINDEMSSEDLAAQARNGSSECFSELVRRHRGEVLGFLTSRASNAADAEDLTQEAFARAHQKLELYDPSRRFTPWLYTIAQRLMLSHYRKRKAMALTHEEMIEDSRPGPAKVLEESDSARNLWYQVADILPPAQLEVLWHRYSDGLSMKEIASKTGRTVVHVKVLLHRARTRLAEQLQREEI
jgi:RNA polymerase sigma-70 factor (ECF subfamily)